MRVAPIGAYFHDDSAQVMMMAERSAKVTHYHPEELPEQSQSHLPLQKPPRGELTMIPILSELESWKA